MYSELNQLSTIIRNEPILIPTCAITCTLLQSGELHYNLHHSSLWLLNLVTCSMAVWPVVYCRTQYTWYKHHHVQSLFAMHEGTIYYTQFRSVHTSLYQSSSCLTTGKFSCKTVFQTLVTMKTLLHACHKLCSPCCLGECGWQTEDWAFTHTATHTQFMCSDSEGQQPISEAKATYTFVSQ